MTVRQREVAYLGASLLAAIVLTWPLLAIFTTRVGGDPGDPFQTLWGMRWMHDALWSFQNPFFTRQLYYPHGSTLVFQTFDLPMTLLVLPLWGFVPEIAIYNTALLVAFALSVYGMFRLARELTGDALVGFLAGVLFAATPYHMAHLQGHLHLVSMGWVPLYLLHLLRLLQGTSSPGRSGRDAVLAGLFLALGSLASWYHLVFAAVITLVLAGWAAVARQPALFSRRFLRDAGILAVTFLLLAGPLLTAIILTRAAEPISGSHDAATFSADVQAFAYPNAAQRWAAAWGSHYKQWSGNSTENAAYVGVTVLLLAVLGAARSGLARAFLVAAVVGAVLALGPQLRVGGRLTSVHLPYWYLEQWTPILAFAGVPVRFGYVMYLGLVAAAAFGLASLRRALVGVAPAAGVLAVLAAVGLALFEYRPRALVTWDYPVPAPMRAWADDPGDWVVLDAWDYYRPMWHAMLHRKPMLNGYLTRVPKRLDDWLHREPVVRSLLYADDDWDFARTDPTIDFAWAEATDGPPVGAGPFSAEWSGTLLMPTAGAYRFWLTANVDAVLTIDGTPVVRRVGPCAPGTPCEASGELTTSSPTAAVRLVVGLATPRATLRLAWQPPGGERAIVPATSLRTADGDPGLSGTYHQRIPTRCAASREEGREALRRLAVRYVVTRVPSDCVERELELPLAYGGEGVRIYEVPAS